MKAMRSIAAIVIGYAVMVAGAWFGQESVFPGTEYGSPVVKLLIVGVMTSLLAGMGGAVTAILAPSRPYLHLLPMAVLISIETISLYVTSLVRASRRRLSNRRNGHRSLGCASSKAAGDWKRREDGRRLTAA